MDFPRDFSIVLLVDSRGNPRPWKKLMVFCQLLGFTMVLPSIYMVLHGFTIKFYMPFLLCVEFEHRIIVLAAQSMIFLAWFPGHGWWIPSEGAGWVLLSIDQPFPGLGYHRNLGESTLS